MRFERREVAAVAVGGFAGAIARTGLAEALPHGVGSWPWATFAVNMAGAFLLGAIAVWLPHVDLRRPLLGAGFCGALTTFSTLQLELVRMVDAGFLGLAAGYAAASVAGGLLAVGAGVALVRRLERDPRAPAEGDHPEPEPEPEPAG